MADPGIQLNAPPPDPFGGSMANLLPQATSVAQNAVKQPQAQPKQDPSVQAEMDWNKGVANNPTVQANNKKYATQDPMPQQEIVDYQSPLNAFKDLVPSLVVLGSSFTKQPLMAAMKAATGAMQGYNLRNKELVEQSVENFKNAIEVWKLKNDAGKEYRERMFDKDGNPNYEAMATYAAAQGDETMQAALATNPAFATRLARDKEKAGLEIDKLHAEVTKIHADAEKDKQIGLMKPEERIFTQFLAEHPDATPMEQATFLRSLKSSSFGSPVKEVLNAWVAEEQNKGHNPTSEEMDVKLNEITSQQSMVNSSARAAGTKGYVIELSSNLLNNSLPILKDAFNKVDNSKFKDLNSFNNYFKDHLNDPDLSALNEAILNTDADLALLIRRGGASTVDSQARADKIINNMMSSKSFDAVADQIRKESKAAVAAEQKTKNDIMGGSKEDDPNRPLTKEELEEYNKLKSQ